MRSHDAYTPLTYQSKTVIFFWNGQQLSRKTTTSTYLNIKRMRILYKDALFDSEYIDNIYLFNDQLCNKGGLTLVST